MKKRSTMLVAIGAVVFVLGAGIVLVSLRHSGSKASGTAVTATSGTSGASATPSSMVYVATKSIPAGTSGETMIEQHMLRQVTVRQAASSYRSDDISDLDSLHQEALAAAVSANEPIESSNLRVAAGTLQPPPGDESVAITISSGAGAGAGYINPGDNVDVYADIKNQSTSNSGSTNLGAATSKGAMPTPCVAPIQSSLEVLDISTTVPAYRSQPTPTGRQVPSSVTVLLAATPAQARNLIYYTSNQTLYLTKASTTEKPVSKSACSALINNPQLTPAS